MSLIFSFVVCQSDVDYYINCKKSGSLKTFQEAVDKAKKEKFEHTHFYICGNVPITVTTDITFRVKMFGYDEGQTRTLWNPPKTIQKFSNESNQFGDDWTKEALEKQAKMQNKVKDIFNKVVAELVIVPGVRIDFRGLTQIHNLALYVLGDNPISSKQRDPTLDASVGFSFYFYGETGIFGSFIGSSTYKTANGWSSAGPQLKTIDSFIGVNKMLVNDKTVQLSSSVFYLNSGGGSEAFMFVKQESNDIGTSYFAGQAGASSDPIVLITANKKVTTKNNNWFDSAIGFHGPCTSLVTSSEWGYRF